MDEERLKNVQYRFDTQETFVVFPDEQESKLRILVRREQLEPELNGVRLKLISEILTEAKHLKRKKHHAGSL